MNEFQLNIGASVHCSDGKCGSLAKVAIAPETWQITHLIVEEGMILKRARAFPFASLIPPTAHDSDAHDVHGADAIHIDATTAQLEDFPIYREEIVELPTPEQAAYGGSAAAGWSEVGTYGGAVVPAPITAERIHHGLPTEVIVVDHRTAVESYQGRIGKLDRFLVNAHDGAITALVVQQGLLFTTRKTLPIALVKSIAEETILIDTAADLDNLPDYTLPPSRPHQAAPDITAPEHPSFAEENLDRTTRIARALHTDPRTAHLVLEIIDERGVITLDGEADTPAARDAAAVIAAAQPGVITVHNLIRLHQ